MVANHLGARGEEIPAGTLILSGGITEAIVGRCTESQRARLAAQRAQGELEHRGRECEGPRPLKRPCHLW